MLFTRVLKQYCLEAPDALLLQLGNVISLCANTTPSLSSSPATFRMFNYHIIPQAALAWRTACILSCVALRLHGRLYQKKKTPPPCGF